MPYTHTPQPLRAIFSALAVLSFLTAASPGWCKVIFVNVNSPGPMHDGATWSSACTTVQAGISAAQLGDEVWVAAGTYVEAITLKRGVALYGGFAGTETARSQRNWKTNIVILDGNHGSNTDVVTSSFPDTVLDGFTVRNGYNGVSLKDYSAKLTVANCTVTGNASYGLSGNMGAATITRTTVTGNHEGVILAMGSSGTTVSSCTITGNQFAGIAVVAAVASITNCTITANGTGVDVSGFSDGQSQAPGRATIINTIVAFNRTGIEADASRYGYATVSHSDVFANTNLNYLGFTDPTGSDGNISQDPKLPNIYHDLHLQPASPCVDAGDDSVIPAGTTDIDGQPRIIGSHVDIGADESDDTTWIVPSRTWYVSPSGSDANDGTSWGTAKKTVGGGLAPAQGGDEVWVAKGTFAENISLPAGTALYGGFSGAETARSQRDWNANVTILDGNGVTTSNVVSTPYLNAVVDGFTVRNGGNGIYDIGSTATVAHCTISGNTTGVYNCAYGTTISACVVSGNKTGIYLQGIATIVNCTINTNPNYGIVLEWGEAMISGTTISGSQTGVNSYYGQGTLTNCTLTRNFDGVFASGGTMTLANCTISGYSYGVYVSSAGAYVTGCLITGNGSGIYDVGWATIANCTIAGVSGSGIDVHGWASITNCILAFNATGVSAYDAAQVVKLSNSDVFGNTITNFTNVADPTGTTGNINQDPMFANRTNGDFHLLAGSPCINAGDDSVVRAGDKDLDGKPRIIGAHVDMGAYEYGVGFTVADAAEALRIVAGLSAPVDVTRWNVAPATPGVDIVDAVHIARMAAGFEPNP